MKFRYLIDWFTRKEGGGDDGWRHYSSHTFEQDHAITGDEINKRMDDFKYHALCDALNTQARCEVNLLQRVVLECPECGSDDLVQECETRPDMMCNRCGTMI